MFKVGDLIVYGNTGVCRVEDIGVPDFTGTSGEVDYYTLVPYYSNKSRIFTPCNNTKIVMRPLVSKKDADKLLKDIDSIEPLDIPDEKSREPSYKEVMRSCNLEEVISLIKTIYVRKCQRLAEGKKVTANDEKYFNMAEDKLCGELSIVLEKGRDDVKNYISEKVKAAV